MSTEKITLGEANNLPPLETPEKREEVSSSRKVDINILLDRVRESKKKENKANLILFGLFASVIFIVGIILSF